MIKRIGIILRKVVFSFGIIYGVDLLLQNVGVHIPINIYTLGITTFLGIPGVLSIFAVFYLLL